VAIATSTGQQRPPEAVASPAQRLQPVAPPRAEAAPSAARGSDLDGAEPGLAAAASPVPVAMARPSPRATQGAAREAGQSSLLPPVETERRHPDPEPRDGGAALDGPPTGRHSLRWPSTAEARRRPDWDGVLLPTAAGGLLFLVRVLHRLELPAWLAAPSAPIEAGFGARLLCDIGRRKGIPADDAGVCVWSDPQPIAALAAQERPALDAWAVRLACWLRERGRVSLRRVVCRPAWLSATRTHVDVLFGSNDADPVLRALGLDVDPGWVPWLGRVVQFHYLEAGRA
jgi:hypothetical protein